MVKLLVENGFKIRQNHIACASRESCQMIICKNVPKDFDSPDVDPDQPQAKAFRAATELGHNELVDVVAKKKDKGGYRAFTNLSGQRYGKLRVYVKPKSQLFDTF
ncbi:hypothetical protein DPV78_011923 [Talaromyces pinophilus]|nr:hypothetical protein DPV78_011923 [Talaromyces pinophilus]